MWTLMGLSLAVSLDIFIDLALGG